MAREETFSCSVITPERKLLEIDATFVALPAHDGEIGILVNRAPLVCKLGAGSLRVESPAGNQTLFVDGGFAQVVRNRLAVLTEDARPASELSSSAAEQALAEARAMKITDEPSFLARDRAMRRARAQLSLAGRRPQ